MDSRYLIVLADKKTDEWVLYNPLVKGKPVVPEGYYKVTQQMPLNEEKYGHLPLLKL